MPKTTFSGGGTDATEGVPDGTRRADEREQSDADERELDQLERPGDQPIELTDTEAFEVVEDDEPEVEPEPVPTGTAADVLEWVDGDWAKAQRARSAEYRRRGERARTSLLAELDRVIATRPDDGSDDDGESDDDGNSDRS